MLNIVRSRDKKVVEDSNLWFREPKKLQITSYELRNANFKFQVRIGSTLHSDFDRRLWSKRLPAVCLLFCREKWLVLFPDTWSDSSNWRNLYIPVPGIVVSFSVRIFQGVVKGEDWCRGFLSAIRVSEHNERGWVCAWNRYRVLSSLCRSILQTRSLGYMG